MSWGSELEDYECNDCGKIFQFKMDTLFIASHGGLPIKCPKCKNNKIEKLTTNSKGCYELIEEYRTLFKHRKKRCNL